jgi:methylamine dehydrogenase heavy chain
MTLRSSTRRSGKGLRLAFLLFACICGTAFAHDLRLARFSLVRGEQPGAYELHVQVGGRPTVSADVLNLPQQCQQGTSNQQVRGGELRLSIEIRCDRSLRQGDLIGVPWGQDGAVFTSMLGNAASAPVLLQGNAGTVFLPAIPAATGSRPLWSVAHDYVYLGMTHILDGADHLAFVLCLCLLTSGLRLLGLITAFTLGHSISLALAFLGVVHVPAPPVEATIALSIAFMAREVLLARRALSKAATAAVAAAIDESLGTRRRHVAVVAGFGLLHGLGFASALGELGVSAGERITGLVFFNLGVEAGQLMFVAVVSVVLLLAGAVRVLQPMRIAALYAAGILGLFWTFDRAVADEPFKREEVTVEQGVGAGPHLYVVGQNRIHLINPDSLKYQGQISTGNYGQFVLSDGGDTVFVASSYYSRGWTGTRTDVVQIYDSTTLQQKAEVAIPTRKAMIGAKRPLLQLSGDSHWLFIQNATPAQSVTAVDTASHKTSEVPTPGCWGIYPARKDPNRFSMLCGDGRLATFTLDSKGRGTGPVLSDPVFDVNKDPLFIDVGADGDMLYLVSYAGVVYTVSTADPQARLIGEYPFATGIPGEWRPGGFQLVAFLPADGVLYVLMHKKAIEGGHADPANEVWAIDVRKSALLSRSSFRPATAITAGVHGEPALYAWEKEAKSVTRYPIDRNAGFTVREDTTIKIEESAPRLEFR